MKLYSTNNRTLRVNLAEAVMNSLPADNGLYMPLNIPKLDSSFINNLKEYSFSEIALEISLQLIGDYIPQNEVRKIIEEAITFPAPVVSLSQDTHILELFHGPSLAFKDFGARFMAKLMGYFNRGADKQLVILVATSGDTGGAVAAGFHNTPGIEVVILYPSGKVSPLQEKQLTTLGGNISALEVHGTFDDCQALVKQAFLDKDLNSSLRLSSANSINIARLIPQSFYYFEAYKQLELKDKNLAFVIPSGNFGNLTAGLLAKQMGLPVDQFIAATNLNDVVPSYLKTGVFESKPSVATISNAMDVGNPSNFSRMLDLFGSTWNNMKKDIEGYSFNDQQTREAMKRVYAKYGYILDPHGAVGYLALEEFKKKHSNYQGLILETAHPSKFLKEVNETLSIDLEIPARLAKMQDRTKSATDIKVNYNQFKSYLLAEY